MEQFGIIEAFEALAESKGWKFVYGIDAYYRSIETTNINLDAGQYVLVCDYKATPTYNHGKITEISYTCLMMLGSKTDSNGTVANLDETSLEKYDRRLKLLSQSLALALGSFSCDNELDLTPFEIIVQQNMFADNIDFVVANNVKFVQ